MKELDEYLNLFELKSSSRILPDRVVYSVFYSSYLSPLDKGIYNDRQNAVNFINYFLQTNISKFIMYKTCIFV